MNPFSLSGKTAIVTGGNGGIGFGMAKGLSAAGASVLIVGRDPAKNRRAAEELRQTAPAESVEIDLTQDDGGNRAVAAAMAHFGRLDILVNNAGTNIRKQPQDYTVAEWRNLMDINLTSAFVCSQAAFAQMQSTGGKIINIGSLNALFGASFSAPYGASKAGLVQMSKALASAWARYNIQVNTVLPGWIDTDLTVRARADVPELHGNVLSRTMAGRWGRPEDLAGVAVFLASAASDFVTGAAIPVDGGFSAQA